MEKYLNKGHGTRKKTHGTAKGIVKDKDPENFVERQTINKRWGACNSCDRKT